MRGSDSADERQALDEMRARVESSLRKKQLARYLADSAPNCTFLIGGSRSRSSKGQTLENSIFPAGEEEKTSGSGSMLEEEEGWGERKMRTPQSRKSGRKKLQTAVALSSSKRGRSPAGSSSRQYVRSLSLDRSHKRNNDVDPSLQSNVEKWKRDVSPPDLRTASYMRNTLASEQYRKFQAEKWKKRGEPVNWPWWKQTPLGKDDPLPIPLNKEDPSYSPEGLSGVARRRQQQQNEGKSPSLLASPPRSSKKTPERSPFKTSAIRNFTDSPARLSADRRAGHIWSSYVDSKVLEGREGREKYLGDEDFDLSKEKLQTLDEARERMSALRRSTKAFFDDYQVTRRRDIQDKISDLQQTYKLFSRDEEKPRQDDRSSITDSRSASSFSEPEEAAGANSFPGDQHRADIDFRHNDLDHDEVKSYCTHSSRLRRTLKEVLEREKDVVATLGQSAPGLFWKKAIAALEDLVEAD